MKPKRLQKVPPSTATIVANRQSATLRASAVRRESVSLRGDSKVDSLLRGTCEQPSLRRFVCVARDVVCFVLAVLEWLARRPISFPPMRIRLHRDPSRQSVPCQQPSCGERVSCLQKVSLFEQLLGRFDPNRAVELSFVVDSTDLYLAEAIPHWARNPKADRKRSAACALPNLGR